MNPLARCIIPAALLAGALHAQSGDSAAFNAGIRVSARGSFEAGQVVQGWERQSYDPTKKVSHVWQEKLLLSMSMRARIKERFEIIVGAEGAMDYSFFKQQEKFGEQSMLPRFYPDHVEGSYSWGDPQKPWLRAGVGYFPFKYNPDVRNLGEYLYRTGTYPQYIINSFDYPQARLLGLHLSSDLFGLLHQDLMLTSETDMVPLADFGLSCLARITALRGLIDVGGGFFWSRLWSVNDQYTTPRWLGNEYRIDSIAPVPPDTVTRYDTSFYSFVGKKLMGRLTIDFKALFPGVSLFGPNDLRLYGEAAVIGLDDIVDVVHPDRTWYNELWRRIPVMAGLNLPTFKILDVLALEVEYFRGKFPNSYENVYMLQNLPQPASPGALINYGKWDDFKWSVYATKTVGRCMTFTAQVANDHMRLVKHDDREMDKEEALRKPGDWWWCGKIGFGF
jgi:hypothetical protein